jgi:predicted CopG family antitoxin
MTSETASRPEENIITKMGDGLAIMSKANKRIPVTEQRWQELNELKRAGQTYDDLLKELIQRENRRQLAEQVQAVREADESELTSLDEL